MCETENLALELSLAKTIDKVQEQLNSLSRKSIILDSQLELLNRVTGHLMALTEVFEDVLKRMPEAPYLEAKLARLIEVSLGREPNEPEQGQAIKEMFKG